MLRASLSLLLLSLAGTLWAGDGPQSSPPNMAIVVSVDADKGTVAMVQVHSKVIASEEEYTVEKIIDGRPQKETRKRVVYKPISEISTATWDAKFGVAFDGAGQKIEPAEVTKRLKKGDVVLMAGMCSQVDPAWQKPLKLQAMLLGFKPCDAEAPAPAAAAPTPVPQPAPGGPAPRPATPAQAAPAPVAGPSVFDERLLPKSAAPRMFIVQSLEASKGTATLSDPKIECKTVQETVTVFAEVNGKKEPRTEMVTKKISLAIPSESTVKLARCKAIDGAGKPIPAAELASRPRVGDTILVGMGDNIDPTWLKPLKSRAVVLLQSLEDSWAEQLKANESMPASVPPLPVGAPPAPAKPAEPKKIGFLSDVEQAVLALANTERKKAGAPPLKADLMLVKAARKHSENMAATGEFAHEIESKGPEHRLTDLGYAWRAVGENIAHRQTTPAQAMDKWMNSPPHKENLLNADFTEAGVGTAKGKDGDLFWTMVFAARR